MFDFSAYLLGLAVILAAAIATWIVSLIRRDVSIVDSMWSLLFVLAALVYDWAAGAHGPRALIMLVIVSIWAVRLSAHITWRNHGQPEDRRYREIRRRNEPNFPLKSLYLVFGFQALLAWVISLPLFAGLSATNPLSAIDYVGAAVSIFGIAFEATADWQLAQFKSDARSRGRVMDRGLWKYSRHPNYFGEFLVWWGLYVIAVGAGAWWSILSPALMSVLLLRVSGVALLERDIGERRPAYAQYVARTNAFFPGPPRAS